MSNKIYLYPSDKEKLITWFNTGNKNVYFAHLDMGDVEAIIDEYDDVMTIRFDARCYHIKFKNNRFNKYKHLSSVMCTKEMYLTVEDFEKITSRFGTRYSARQKSRQVSGSLNPDSNGKLRVNKLGAEIVFHDDAYFDTKDKDVVVIEYVHQPEGYSTLLSMTVGKYYIVRKRMASSGMQYELITLNKFERKGTAPIAVNKDEIRFEEYKITRWGHDQRGRGIYPVIDYNGNELRLNPFTGQPFDMCNKIVQKATQLGYTVTNGVSEFERMKQQTWDVLQNHPKINNHKTDVKCGMDETYLLL